MGEQSNSESRKWEEDIYWNHFKSLHFFQSLSAGFHHLLAIPKKFTNNLREKLAESVVLKGPSGTTWNVGLTASDDTLILKHGWSEFVADHSLKEDDLLVFKYNGDSRFDVLIFDPLSCCEKEALYFVRKPLRIEPEKRCDTKRKVTEVAEDTSPDVVGSTLPPKLRKDSVVEQTLETNSKRIIEELIPETDNTRIISEETTPQTNDSKIIEEEPTPRTNRRMRGAITTTNVHPENSSTRVSYYRSYFESNRRPVTEEEKHDAFQRALAAKSKDGLVVVMRPSHVYRGFFMGINSEWANTHLPYKNQDVILRVGQSSWKVSLYCRIGAGRGLQGGWKNFVAENFLEEFDACLFELDDDDENDEIVMDVNIFRVVEPVVPPKLITHNPPKGRNTSKHRSRRKRNLKNID